MHKLYSTEQIPHEAVATYWCDAICDALLPLDTAFRAQGAMHGRLEQWQLNTASLSWLEGGGLVARRLPRHCGQKEERQLLLTVPRMSDVEFSQLGRTARCRPGQFVLEDSDEPYEFGYGDDNTMWVIKLPAAAVESRIGEARRYSARTYDGTQGVGRLFSDYLELVGQHCRLGQSQELLSTMGGHLVDLLALSLRDHPDVLQSQHSAVRDAHLSRIDGYVRRHLSDAELSPERIAQGCGISLRYLHTLFKDRDRSVSQWIRDLRLQFAHEALTRADRGTSVASVAYAAGFSDHAKFSNAFRSKFGHPPGELLRRRG